MNKKIIIAIIGESGAGKDTFAWALHDFCEWNMVTLSTTRPIRDYEVEDEDSSITFEISKTVALVEDAILSIDMTALNLVLTGDNAGHEATVAVSGDFGDSDAMVFAAVLKEGIKVTLKKVAEVAVEDETVEEPAVELPAEEVQETVFVEEAEVVVPEDKFKSVSSLFEEE